MQLTTEQSKRIQVLRGLAVIAVVFIHNTPNGLAQVFVRPFLNFSVGLFLFLSGMLSSSANWNPKKRIAKVLIPYVFWTLVYTVISNPGNWANVPVTFFKHVITGRAAGIMYYIFVYCEFTLLIPLIDRLAKSRFKYWGFLIAPLEIIFMRTIPLITGMEMHKYLDMILGVSCLGWFTYFYLGYLLGNNLLPVDTDSKKLPWLWALSILFQFAEGFYYYSLGFNNSGTQLKITTVLSGVLFALMAYNYITRGKSKNVKLLELLGDHSFGIYFSHLAVMAAIQYIPGYTKYAAYPLNAVIAVVFTAVFVILGKSVLGKYSKYLGF